MAIECEFDGVSPHEARSVAPVPSGLSYLLLRNGGYGMSFCSIHDCTRSENTRSPPVSSEGACFGLMRRPTCKSSTK
eukprot:scaffold1000_cov68-Phaeocystis_antarctica.AAC.3